MRWTVLLVALVAAASAQPAPSDLDSLVVRVDRLRIETGLAADRVFSAEAGPGSEALTDAVSAYLVALGDLHEWLFAASVLTCDDDRRTIAGLAALRYAPVLGLGDDLVAAVQAREPTSEGARTELDALVALVRRFYADTEPLIGAP